MLGSKPPPTEHRRCDTDPTILISLARQTNLWQSIHHGKQRQRQARSKETKEDHSKTTPGSPRRQPDPGPRHQKSRRIAPRKISLIHSRSAGYQIPSRSSSDAPSQLPVPFPAVALFVQQSLQERGRIPEVGFLQACE